VTSTALVEARPATLVAFDLSRLLEGFFAGRKERTIAAYRADLEDFRAFVGVATMGEASSRLLSGSHGEANAAAIARWLIPQIEIFEGFDRLPDSYIGAWEFSRK
jgi:hypothetical protein